MEPKATIGKKRGINFGHLVSKMISRLFEVVEIEIGFLVA